jgi:hypothetical protein
MLDTTLDFDLLHTEANHIKQKVAKEEKEFRYFREQLSSAKACKKI